MPVALRDVSAMCGYALTAVSHIPRDLSILFLATNAESPSGCSDAARISNHSPETGFDDMKIARLATPALTSVRPPREEAGTQAVEMLLERVAGRSVEGRVLVPEVVVRESTAVVPDLITT